MLKFTIEKEWPTRSGLQAIIVLIDIDCHTFHCGYVGVPSTHSLHKLHFTDIALTKEPHGGITYSGYLDNLPRDIDFWYLGFDCNHDGDTLDIYTLDFCINECERLSDQLQEVEPN